jgi:hypothetical protein
MATSKFIKLKTEPFRVEFAGGVFIADVGLYEFFKQYPAAEYDKVFEKALRLGAYAWEEERIAAFLGRAENELDAGLERLKVIYKMVHMRDKSPGKGTVAERELSDVLQDYIDKMGWKDEVAALGDKIGLLPRRKVGDLVVRINGTDLSVVIESKMDASVQVGDPTELDERAKKSGNAEKSAYGQNLTALVNRGAQVAIAVFDRTGASGSIEELDDIAFLPELPGFIVKIDRARGEFGNACAAYAMARAMALMGADKICGARLDLVAKRLVRDLGVLAQTESELEKIEEAVESITGSVGSIRETYNLTKESLERTQELLRLVLAGETPTLDQFRLYFKEAKDK